MRTKKPDPDQPRRDEQAIVALVAARQEAWNAGDTVAYAQLLTEDADIVSATGRPARGREAVLKLYAEQHANAFAGVRTQTTVTQVRMIGGDAALADVSYALEGGKVDSIRRGTHGHRAAQGRRPLAHRGDQEHSGAIDMSTDLFSLKGRTALITGGSRGIGRMIAAGFIAQGAKVYISSRKADACEKTAAELSKGGGACIALPVDASTVAGAQALAGAYAARESKLDILVNNAGAAWLEKFDKFPEKGWDKVAGPQPEDAVLPDPGAARRAQGGREQGAAGQGDQHRLHRRLCRSTRRRPTPTPPARRA